MLYQKIAAAVSSLAGVQVRQTMGRVYPYGEATAAITGYVAPITRAQLKADTSHYYDQGDLIGEAGIEAWGEQYLHPIKGGTLTINGVNSKGTVGRTVYTIAAKTGSPGKSIYTTISINEELAAMHSLVQKAKDHGGSAVALDPGTGDVLAMASTPTYDPNDFSLGFTPNALARYTALDQPNLNRATQGAYPIDSVFKVVTLAAALGSGVKPTDTYACSSSYQVPGETGVRQDPDPTCKGSLTLPKALASSSDVIFWEVGVQLNNENQSILSSTAKAFGYGSPTGIIGLPVSEESSGFVPTPQNVGQEGQSWTPSVAADLATGQGDFQATPLQVAEVSAAIGNGGKRMQPILVSRVVSADGKSVAQFKSRQTGTLPLNAGNLAAVQAALVAATNSPTSAYYSDFHSFPIQVAGNTGTARSGEPNPQALSTAYAPAPVSPTQSVQPQIATAVVIEDIGTGNSYAAPVSLAMLSTYFNIA
jgi:penicillin-binding protein 2